MRPVLRTALVLMACCAGICARAQTPQVIKGADERYKVDILIVAAHPDDEGFFTPYAAKAIYDMHKRVAVVFSTHGESGKNHNSRAHGPAVANEREIEAREACAKLSIANVWFLDGKDTPSQDPLNSLSNWGHGANLERLVGIIRLTRPEVIFTHFPGAFIGENHGDHQATGVLVTEAFDLAADPTVFPSQVAGPNMDREVYLSNLQPWQVKKIYFGSDARNQKLFEGTGPTYSVREVSPSQKKPYWRLAMEAATAHRTQFADEIDQIVKGNNPDDGWWPEPETLIFGKSVVGGKPTDDVFAHIDDKIETQYSEAQISCGNRVNEGAETGPRLELGGPWKFYAEFYPKHGYCQLPVAKEAEIGIKAGSTLMVPLVIHHDSTKPLPVTLKVKAPDGWKVGEGAGPLLLPAEESTALLVHIETPALSSDELKKAVPEEVRVTAEAEGKRVGEAKLRVLLRVSAQTQ